jgi:hypothetical protein
MLGIKVLHGEQGAREMRKSQITLSLSLEIRKLCPADMTRSVSGPYSMRRQIMRANDNVSKRTHFSVKGTNVKSLQVLSLSSFADPGHAKKKNAQIPMAPLPGDMVLNV